MALWKARMNWWLPALLAMAFLAGVATAEPSRTALPLTVNFPPGEPQSEPPQQVDARGAPQLQGDQAGSPVRRPDPRLLVRQPGEHPLVPALRWAREAIRDLESIKDYSFTMAMRLQIGGKLGDYQYSFVKIRHKPFSVYMYMLAPEDTKGTEVIYIDGRNNGLMWAHGVGMQRKLFGTISLRPTGPVAMRGQHYPLTEIGMLNMLKRLVEIGEKDMRYGECEVKFYEGAKVNDRPCTCIEVVHPVPRRNFIFHVARIFADNELNVPARFEAYEWPRQPGGPPVMTEEYTFLNVKLNVGFTDADFDTRNPNYNFP
jgi:hypothetical protein